jgi:hypothetical protein
LVKSRLLISLELKSGLFLLFFLVHLALRNRKGFSNQWILRSINSCSVSGFSLSYNSSFCVKFGLFVGFRGDNVGCLCDILRIRPHLFLLIHILICIRISHLIKNLELIFSDPKSKFGKRFHINLTFEFILKLLIALLLIGCLSKINYFQILISRTLP